jgi:hypothetical protein
MTVKQKFEHLVTNDATLLHMIDDLAAFLIEKKIVDRAEFEQFLLRHVVPAPEPVKSSLVIP